MKATKKIKMHALKSAKIGRKNKKVKGFTLVELIIVIAIIGVLAAILIPTMSGKVKESKWTTANDGAAKIAEQAAIVITELDVAGTSVIADGSYKSADISAINTSFKDKIEKNVPAIKGGVWAIKVDKGSVVAVAYAKTTSDKYVGTYPKTNKETDGCTAADMSSDTNKETALTYAGS